jgi:peptidoglycan-N-acetylglucosamine deacetylase
LQLPMDWIRKNIRTIVLSAILAACAALYAYGYVKTGPAFAARDLLRRRIISIAPHYVGAVEGQLDTVAERIKSGSFRRDFSEIAYELRRDREGQTGAKNVTDIGPESKRIADGDLRETRRAAHGFADRLPEKDGPLLPPELPVTVSHGPRSLPVMSLTFDSGDTGGGTDFYNRLIGRLLATRTPATFFLTGRFIEARPEIARRIAGVSFFELGNHSYSHRRMTELSDREVVMELKKTQAIMFRATGMQARLFRAPYGDLDRRVVEIAAGMGMRTVQWDVDPRDFSPSATADGITGVIERHAKSGSIVLMHMHGGNSATIGSLDGIMRTAGGKGLRLVTVSEMLQERRLNGGGSRYFSSGPGLRW